MTKDVSGTDTHGPDDENTDADRFGGVLLDPRDERAASDSYPCLRNISAGFVFQSVLRADNPAPSEYVTVQLPAHRHDPRLEVAISDWNMLWEAAQFRRYIGADDLPPQLARVADREDVNVVFVPRTQSRYFEYAPLFHLLPRVAVERQNLPLLARGQWPFLIQGASPDSYLPADFGDKLSRAWAGAVWRHLMPTSSMRAYSDADPIRILAHNLDFWIPPVNAVIEDELRGFPIVDKQVPEGPAVLDDGSILGGAMIGNPRTGGVVWAGEVEAAGFVERAVDKADAGGRLRAVLDAVRSNRVEDDFSPYWTRAREDFERTFNHTRAKVQVRFVEVPDTIPVQGPETEVVDRMVYGDFLTLLNERDREIVVLLYSGTTKLTEIGETLGYGSHSAVSKRLNRIRQQAARFFDVE